MPNAGFRASGSILVLGLALWSASAQAQAIEEFYKGKRIDFIVSTAAGAPYDVWARAIGRHMGRHIPGNPTFVVKNMPGGGHTIATNFLYNEAARDGSVVAMVSRNMPTQELLENPAVRFKSANLNWIGASEAGNRVCVIAGTAKVQKADDLLKEEAVFGGTGAGSGGVTTPTLLSKLFGMKFKVVGGYTGTPDIFLAMARGEVEGVCQNLDGVESNHPGSIEQGKLRVLFNLEKRPISGIPGISAPSIHAFAKTEEERQILSFYNSNTELGWPVMTAPDVPPDRLNALRRGYDATMKDPEFLDEAGKLGLRIVPITGEETAAIARAIAGTPKTVVDKTIGIVGAITE